MTDITLKSRMRALQQMGSSQSSKPEEQGTSLSNDLLIAQLLRESRTGPRGSVVSALLSAGFEALDLLNVGLVVCGNAGELLVANQTAQRLLKERDGLELDSDDVLYATQDNSGALREWILRVARETRTPKHTEREGAIAVHRPSGKRPLTLLVRAVQSTSETRLHNQPAVLVMILDSAVSVQKTELELRQLYGLTSTEAQLANLLMEGLALEDCCHALGIRRTTARMHLRNIFAKTGVRRQGELVSLLLKSIGLGPKMK